MDMEKHIEGLINRAANADKSDDALKFSQAACNAANALCALGNATYKQRSRRFGV